MTTTFQFPMYLEPEVESQLPDNLAWLGACFQIYGELQDEAYIYILVFLNYTVYDLIPKFVWRRRNVISQVCQQHVFLWLATTSHGFLCVRKQIWRCFNEQTNEQTNKQTSSLNWWETSSFLRVGMVFSMIHVKDFLLPWGKVWSLDFLAQHWMDHPGKLTNVKEKAQPWMSRCISYQENGKNFQRFRRPVSFVRLVNLIRDSTFQGPTRRQLARHGNPNLLNGNPNSLKHAEFGSKKLGEMWNKWFCSSFPNVIVAALCMCHVLSRYLAILCVSFPSGCIFTRSISHLGTGQLFGCVIVGFDFLSQWCPIYFLFALHKDASHLGFSWYKQLIRDECSHICSWYKQ